jgi:hypothetical protein
MAALARRQPHERRLRIGTGKTERTARGCEQSAGEACHDRHQHGVACELVHRIGVLVGGHIGNQEGTGQPGMPSLQQRMLDLGGSEHAHDPLPVQSSWSCCLFWLF